MTTSTEAAREAARHKDGKFGEQAHSEPKISLLGPPAGIPPRLRSGREMLNELLLRDYPDAVFEAKRPATKSECKRLLSNPRGEKDGKVRVVDINWEIAPDSDGGDRVEIVGPKDGRPIVLNLHSGIPYLRVASGKAIILADSSWGNSIDVADGAEATVIASRDTKTSVDVAEGGKATLVSDTEKNRFREFGKGEIIVDYGQPGGPAPYVHPAPYDFLADLPKQETAAHKQS